ncbi:hypothetical protein ES707_01300 [subsurface metagenome]
MNKPDFKFTLDDLNNVMIEALKEQPEQAKPQGKPNLIQMMRAKKEQGKTEWPLT